MNIPNVLPKYNEMNVEQKMNIIGIAVTDLKEKSDVFFKLLISGDPPSELPLPERTRNLETFRNDFRYWFRILIGALILQTVAFGYGIFIAVVKFLPVLERLSTKP